VNRGGVSTLQAILSAAPNASPNLSIGMLLQALEERPEHHWREGDIEKMGFDLSTVRRSFKR